MAHAGQAPKRSPQTIPVTIKNGSVNPNPANAIVGDTVEFHNEESSSKVVQFLDDGVAMAIALEIPSGGKSEFLATVEGSVDYTIGLGSSDGGSFSPDDDPYQVIVGSSEPA
jgi:hypothetical protein